MLLQHGESLLRSAFAVLKSGITPEAALGPGVLYLTNHRLVFESGRIGRLGRRTPPATVVDAPLTEVKDLGVTRRRVGGPRLEVALPIGRPTFDVLEPQEWVAAIALAKRSSPPPGATVTERVTIERQVVKVRCRYCSTLGNEVDGRCPSCGAPL
jgi:hypothetical protein